MHLSIYVHKGASYILNIVGLFYNTGATNI